MGYGDIDSNAFIAIDGCMLPCGDVTIAIENGHRNREFSHSWHGDFP